MAIQKNERDKMLAVRLCGPRVITRLESIGITKLEDLADRDPHQLVHHVNIAAGRPIWRPPMATQAMNNLINAARNANPRSGISKNLLGSRHRSSDRADIQPA